MQPIVASCSTCKLRPKEDGGEGKCLRTDVYPELRRLTMHDCPLFQRQPVRRDPGMPTQEGLF